MRNASTGLNLLYPYPSIALGLWQNNFIKYLLIILIRLT